MPSTARYHWSMRMISGGQSSGIRPLLLVGGDTAPVGKSANLLRDGKAVEVFGELTSLFRRAGWTVVNQECPLIESAIPSAKIGVQLSAPTRAAKGLGVAGIKAEILSNNHIMDHGEAGLQSTVAALNRNGIAPLGLTKPFAQQPAVNDFEVFGRRISLLALAEHEFNWDRDFEQLPNPLRPAVDVLAIATAAEQCDLLVVVIHGGPEHYPYPSPRMVETYRAFAEAGADVVIGCHSHCIMGSEIHRGTPIVYGLGNLLFDKPGALEATGQHWNYGLLAAISMGRNSDAQVELIPITWDTSTDSLRFVINAEFEAVLEYYADISQPIQNEADLFRLWETFCASQTPHFVKELLKGMVAISPGIVSNLFSCIPGIPAVTLFPRRFKQGMNLLRGFAWCENHREEWATITELARKGRWWARYKDREAVKPQIPVS